MAAPAMTDEECKAALDLVARYPSLSAAARASGISRSTLQSRHTEAVNRLGRLPKETPRTPDADLDAMRDRVFELEAQIRSAKRETLDEEYVKRKIIGIAEKIGDAPLPKWIVEMPRDRSLPGVPIAIWSDWHWGEVVFPAQINGVNEFNLEIAHRRARSLVEKTIYLLRQHIVNPKYPGIVVNLGGDMMSGDLHDELTETNEVPMMPCLLDLYGVLRWAVSALADEFGRVFLPCVSGNHGRNTKKPRAKGRNFTNFDWLLYRFLEKSFAGDRRVTFFIPDGPDALYNVVGHKFLLCHGDSFRGGDGMIGHFGPVLRGQKKKLARNSTIGLEFDTMLHGHFHTYFPTSGVIGNGSLKGLDEYAFQGNFGYEPPIQALFLTHPEHGITIHMPIYLEKTVGRLGNANAEWVTWHKQ
jgi:hypothetical protein